MLLQYIYEHVALFELRSRAQPRNMCAMHTTSANRERERENKKGENRFDRTHLLFEDYVFSLPVFHHAERLQCAHDIVRIDRHFLFVRPHRSGRKISQNTRNSTITKTGFNGKVRLKTKNTRTQRLKLLVRHKRYAKSPARTLGSCTILRAERRHSHDNNYAR